MLCVEDSHSLRPLSRAIHCHTLTGRHPTTGGGDAALPEGLVSGGGRSNFAAKWTLSFGNRDFWGKREIGINLISQDPKDVSGKIT